MLAHGLCEHALAGILMNIHIINRTHVQLSRYATAPCGPLRIDHSTHVELRGKTTISMWSSKERTQYPWGFAIITDPMSAVELRLSYVERGSLQQESDMEDHVLNVNVN